MASKSESKMPKSAIAMALAKQLAYFDAASPTEQDKIMNSVSVKEAVPPMSKAEILESADAAFASVVAKDISEMKGTTPGLGGLAALAMMSGPGYCPHGHKNVSVTSKCEVMKGQYHADLIV